MKPKSHFFEKIKKIDKPLATFIQKKRKKERNEIRNEKREGTVQRNRIVRDYYHKQLYADKTENPEETDKLQEERKTDGGRKREKM